MRSVLLAVLPSWISINIVNALFNGDHYTFPVSITLKDGEEFDYIVVGAGAGGSAAAARIALAGENVLLVEAGGDPNVISKIPAAAVGLLGSDLDWQYKTLPNNMSCLSSEGQQCRFSRGKCLGGSSSINYMLYTRGNRLQDFQDIPYPGWTYDDLMPYFLRYEGLQNLTQLPPSSKTYHNTSGTMRIGFFDDSQNPWHSRLIKSFRSLNFPLNPDINAESQIGVSKVVGYVFRGQRMSTARGYLARDDVKRFLKVAKNTMCTGLIIDDEKITRGISAVQGSQSLKLYARKEVILSAGAIGTPEILMLSGIGSADHLREMGIPVKVDLPIGDGMTDHVLPLLIIQVETSAKIKEKLKLLATKATQLAELLVAWRGALTSNGLTDINIFANTHCYDFERRQLRNESSDGSNCEVPNLQIISTFVDRYLIPAAKPLVKQAINFNDEVIEQLSEANKNHALIVMSPILLEPRSTGTVRLVSRNPLSPPAIYPNYLGDERDVEEMVRSIGIVDQMLETRWFRRRNASLLHLRLAGCGRYSVVSATNYWRCYVRHMTHAVYHAAGTVPLGPALDPRLRIKGVKRLRVADLSVLPKPPRATTAAVAIAIGERVADFVLKDNKL